MPFNPMSQKDLAPKNPMRECYGCHQWGFSGHFISLHFLKEWQAMPTCSQDCTRQRSDTLQQGLTQATCAHSKGTNRVMRSLCKLRTWITCPQIIPLQLEREENCSMGEGPWPSRVT